MKNYLKIAAKHLIRSAASSHDTTPRVIVMLFCYAVQTQVGSSLREFANLLQMCLTHKQDIEAFAATSGASPIDVQKAVLTQLKVDQYDYLYHTIDNFYVRGAKEFSDLTFYPRIEDLFPKAPKPTPLVAAVTATIEKTEEVEDFGELARIGFVGVPQKIITWNAQQNQAFNRIWAWLRTPKKNRSQIFRMFGYAGVGKTEMSKFVAAFVAEEAGKNNVPVGDVLYSAYTGKACSVLRIKGCRGADTLHSLLYRPKIDPDTGVCTGFVLNGESPLGMAALLIVDEASMVDEEMAPHILAFGVPVLVLGDPAQLPPVTGEGYFTNAQPDFMLTTIERQAEDNPIIYLATRVRNGKALKPGRYGESVVYAQGKHISDDMLADQDQILCGLNATRKTINKRMRRINGKGEKSPIYPTAGDRLVCLRNNKLSGLYNGTLWTASRPVIQKVQQPIYKGSNILRSGNIDVLSLKVRSIDEMDPQGKPYVIKTQVSLHMFNLVVPEPAYRDTIGCDQWDFGYGLTTHKSQGSQWDNVGIYDESDSFRDDRHKHRYTGITRAAERATIFL